MNNMLRLLLTVFILSLLNPVGAQYANDNILFKTISAEDLCRELKNKSGYLLLDVRSPGEFNDTSANSALNVGHLNGALNIDIRQLGQRLNEIAAYRSKPVYVYCTSSQRSRRASKMLADSGFTNVLNINAGITGLYLIDEQYKACLPSMLKTSNPYTVLSPKEVCKKLEKPSSVFLLDVRPDSVWEHKSSNARYNAYGYLKGTRHISVSNLASRIDELPKNKEIILIDLNGTESAVAARLLNEKGFGKVYVMLEGMDRWLNSDHSKGACARDLYIPAADFSIISTEEFARLRKNTPGLVLLDLRTREEFENRHAQAFRNIGHLEGAIHLPASELVKKIEELQPYKSRPVVLYAFGATPEVYTSANILRENGFRNVRVLSTGLFNIRWTAANIPGMSFMNSWVVDIPAENR